MELKLNGSQVVEEIVFFILFLLKPMVVDSLTPHQMKNENIEAERAKK